MAITTDRKSPGIVGIIFGVGLSLTLGALLAVILYVFKPVEIVRSMPKEPVDGVRYFIEGESSSGASRSWERKASLVEAGGGATSLTEAELNAWSDATFETVKVDEAAKSGSAMLIAGKPNFRISGESLQIGMINELVFFGTQRKLVMQVKGAFIREGDGWGFKQTESFLGGLPLHKMPMVAELVAKRFSPVSQMPEDVAKVLKSATRISVGDDAVTITMP